MSILQRLYRPCFGLVLSCLSLTAFAQQEQPEASLSQRHLHPEIVETEGMNTRLHLLLNHWYAREHMPVDTADMLGALPYFSDSVYASRLRRLPCVIDMTFNDVVYEYIQRYTTRLRASVTFMLGAQNYYMPLFEEALEAEGVPLELKYLPIIESALDPTATSRVGAAGLWQFMIPTGKRYGLNVTTLVDERRDPVKSSRAAARYLKDLYRQFGDWTLALAAYNCGPTNVQKAITRSGGARNYWEIYDRLPKETRGYVPAFIAANYVMNYYCAHKIPAMRIDEILDTDTILVHSELHFQQIAEQCKLDVKIIEALNPQYRRSLIPGHVAPSPLRLPSLAIDNFLAREAEISAYRAAELHDRSRTAEWGNRNEQSTAGVSVASASLSEREVRALERAARTSGQRLATSDARQSTSDVRQNSSDLRRARADKKLSRREQKLAAAEARKSKRSRRHAEPEEVKVRSGETLSEIAKKNGTTVSKLRKLNGMKGSRLQIGEKLRVR